MGLSPRLPLIFLLLFASAVPLPGQTGTPPLAIRDVTMVDVHAGALRPQRTVLIRGDRITAVGPTGSVAVPADARVVDGTGRYLIPGLWDMHAHHGSDRDTREVIYPLFVAHGVTGIRNMGADCFDCSDSIERVHARRRAVAAGELIGPREVASSDYAGSHEQAATHSTEGSSPQAPATEADARAFVRLVKERGVDFIKIYDMLPREAYFALAEEAIRLGLPFAGHVPVEVRASEASDAGHASIEHPAVFGILTECSSREDELRARLIAALKQAGMGSRHDSEGSTLLRPMLEMVDTPDLEKCAALAERFVRNGTWVVPTLMVARLPGELGRGWREDPYARFLTPEERRYFEWEEEVYARDLGDAEEQAPVSRWVREITGTLHREGVPMLAGSDAGSAGVFWGIGLHQELQLLVDAGLTEAEALRAATLAPAEFLEATDSLGTVEPGKVADLVLLEANPLEDIRNTQRIHAVVFNGRYFDRPSLDTLLAGVEAAARGSETVHVPPPTGVRETDRASILAAVEQVEAGGTVLFAPGRYLIGGSIDVSVPRVTLLGHADGTILRGCEPEDLVDIEPTTRRCAGLELSGDHQTVRNLTFEHISWASLQIIGGRSDAGHLLPATTGGHLIEGNTFRDSDSFNVISEAPEPIVIRDNTFVNTYHAVAIMGRNVHFLDNQISAPTPERIPYGRADIAIGVAQFDPSGPSCADNLIAGNRIERHSDGIAVGVFAPGTSCRGIVIRDNTISVSRAALSAADRAFLGPDADSVQVGVALRLLNYPGWCQAMPPGQRWKFCRPDESGAGAALVDNVIEGNRIVGGQGVAIEMLHASRTRIVGNMISGVRRWERFPAGVLRHPPGWGEANGAGIWVSPGSDENEIAGNTFKDVAGSAVVIEGDGNQVELKSPDDAVRDLGTDNRVTRGAGVPRESATLQSPISCVPLKRMSPESRMRVAIDLSESEDAGRSLRMIM